MPDAYLLALQSYSDDAARMLQMTANDLNERINPPKVSLSSIAEKLILMAVDLVLILVAYKAAVLIRMHILPHASVSFMRIVPVTEIHRVWWIFVIWLFFFAYAGIYTGMLSFWSEMRAIVLASMLSTVGVFVIVSIGRLSEDISRTIIVLMGFISLFVIPTLHPLSKRMLKAFGFFKRKALIIGAGETGQWVNISIRQEKSYNFEVCGFLDDNIPTGTVIDGVRVLGTLDESCDIISLKGITDLYIAIQNHDSSRTQELVNTLQHMVDRTFIVSDITGIAVLGTRLHQFADEQGFALEVQNNLANPLSIIIKRALDLASSIILLPILALPMAIIAAIIKIDSPGPAFLAQERIGRKGRNFKCYKFRTMYSNADQILEEILARNPENRKEWEEGWKLKDDPRVTRIGRFLRKGYLDELPQIFNVLIGNMSLVGPRPYLPRELGSILKYADKILLPKPGITGLWQVSGQQSNNYRVYLDMWYVRNWNLWLDITIILRTIKLFFAPSASPYRR